jgi:hypothetical protein
MLDAKLGGEAALLWHRPTERPIHLLLAKASDSRLMRWIRNNLREAWQDAFLHRFRK